MVEEVVALIPNVIYEAIVTTFDQEEKPNAAPMGIALTDNGLIAVRPFTQSDTFKNLWTNEVCVVNFTYDPVLFVYCTLFQDELLSNAFEKAPRVNAPILRSCRNNFLALKVLRKVRYVDGERSLFQCRVIHSENQPAPPPPFTRALSSLIEILIHATRVIHFSRVDSKDSPEVIRLRKLIDHHSEVIRRVAPVNSIYFELLRKVLEKLANDLGEKRSGSE